MPLVLLSENARVEIWPIFFALVKGPLITFNASLKLNDKSFMRAAAISFDNSMVFFNAVEKGVEESGETLYWVSQAKGKLFPSSLTYFSPSFP